MDPLDRNAAFLFCRVVADCLYLTNTEFVIKIISLSYWVTVRKVRKIGH